MSDGNTLEKTYWPSKWVFVLAAIGSAAGLGNIWRFPFLAYEHGGGAFIVALILANIIIGIPILALEVGLGQMMQKGAPDAFGAIKKKFRIVGWLALVMSGMVLSYYMAVMAWSYSYFISAFKLSWGSETSTYFFENILHLSESVTNIGGFAMPVLIGFIISWILVYFSAWKGVHSVSHVVKWTATLPFIILIVLTIRALTLPGSNDGLLLYLIPDWQLLLDPQLWFAALSQVFFSLSLAFGIMIAYGSANRRDSGVTKGVVAIAAGNFLVSFLSGFVVFGTLGYMANSQDVAVADVVAGGPSLIFVVFPQALNLLPAFNRIIAVLFFATILTLAIDSAFSLLEAFSTAIRDRFPHLSTKKTSLWVASTLFIAGLPFTTGAGLYFLDIIDHFIVSYGLVAVGFLQALVVGWLWKGDELREFINMRSGWKLAKPWTFSIRYLTPILMITLFIINFVKEFEAPYGEYPVHSLIFLGALPILVAPIIALILDKLTTKRISRDL